MTDRQVGRSVRALRHRRNWTQAELGRRADCSASLISRLERGQARSCSLATIRRILEALDAWIFMKVVWRGGELDRLLDADHSAIQEAWDARKRAARSGWLGRHEVTYSIYGERGSIDDLAYHPDTRTLLVTEIKSGLYDVQETLARLDQKERLGREVARRFGWEVDHVVACLIVAEGRSNRRRVEMHPALFGRFDCRGRGVAAWLRAPNRPVGGLLLFEKLSVSRGVHGRRAGRQRVRHRRVN
ncbi:MAG: helix-turn-helix domain-containing protein [Candidatus Limnocylindria bacterium]